MNKEKALSLAAAICSKKEHCSWEIQEKLVKWEIPEKEIAKQKFEKECLQSESDWIKYFHRLRTSGLSAYQAA